MLVVSCTKCDGWVAIVADEGDPSLLAYAVREESRKPDRRVTTTRDPYVESEWKATGMCRASSRNCPCNGAEFESKP